MVIIRFIVYINLSVKIILVSLHGFVKNIIVVWIWYTYWKCYCYFFWNCLGHFTTYVTIDTPIQVWTIIHAGVLTTCWWFIGYQYPLPSSCTQFKYVALTESYPGFDTFPWGFFSSFSVTGWDRNLGIQYSIVVGSVVLMVPYLPVFTKQFYVVADAIKENLTNKIKLLSGFIFVTKGFGVPVVLGEKHRTIYSVLNRLVVGLWHVGYTRCSGLVQNVGIWHTSTGYI